MEVVGHTRCSFDALPIRERKHCEAFPKSLSHGERYGGYVHRSLLCGVYVSTLRGQKQGNCFEIVGGQESGTDRIEQSSLF